jgi:DNA-binding response OmpR family regulator
MSLGRGNSSRARVLVVDDERHIARFLEFVLKRADYEVAVAYNGEQALAAVTTFVPHVVLLDLVLPGISGLEVVKRIRADANQADLVVIILSRRSFGDAPAEIVQAGANAHCTKPIAPSTLLKMLLDLGVPARGQAPATSPCSDEVGNDSP